MQSAEDARRRAEAERKRIEDERKRAEEAKLAAEARAAEPAKNRPMASGSPAATAKVSATVAATAAGGNGKFDGTYEGQMCNFPNNPDRRSCWNVVLHVQNGAADIEWPNRLVGKQAHAHITIAPNGGVSCALDGYARDGTALPGAMVGHLADNHIDARGRWNNGTVIDGHWTRTP